MIGCALAAGMLCFLFQKETAMRLLRSARVLVPALLAAFLLAAPTARAAVKLAPVFASHMVLQRGMPVPVWGTATAGVTVVVSFAGQRKEARADARGVWRVMLDPLAVSAEPRPLTVTAGAGDTAEKAELADVLVGDVWVGSGQSNMAMMIPSYTNGDPVLAKTAAGAYPLLRLYKGGGVWLAASNASFSALLFSFGQPLQQELGVPVGLMCGAVGGTPSGYWLSESAYQDDPGCQADLAKARASFNEAAYGVQMTAWSQDVAKAKEAGKPEPAQPRVILKPGQSRAKVGNLYEAHIRPFQPFAIRGVLWDQGESNTGIGGVNQSTLMNALVRGWRKEWGQGDFPFLVMQKPSGGGIAFDPADPVTRCADRPSALPSRPPANGFGREEYLKVGAIPGVFMVPTSDLGPGTHPVCKSGYGARAVRVALGAVYGKPVEVSGPVFKSFAVEGGKVRIRFDHVGKGLAVPPSVTNNAGPQGFSVAGTNQVFQWARAVIDGDSVVVDSTNVPAPVAVRYAWSSAYPWATLFNRDGLPALTFRTDDWADPEPAFQYSR
jgi:sialate O-acetylesterase